jgi:molecular chaperone GrpE
VSKQPSDQPLPRGQGPEAADASPAGELEQARAERDQLQDQLQRTLADLQNMRRRQSIDLQEHRRKTLEGLAQELLPVLDNFHAALQFWDAQDPAAPRDPAPLVEGVRLVRTLLSSALERHGLQEVTAEGQAFDPSLHEAVGVDVRPGVPAGRVLKVLQRGYAIGDRVIRPARVLVSGNAPGQDASASEEPTGI